MSDPRLLNLAKILVYYSQEIKPGDWVVIRGNVIGMPLIEAVYEEVIKAGGHAELDLFSDNTVESFYQYASDDQLKWLSPFAKPRMEKVDSIISIGAGANTRALTNVPSEKQQIRQLAARELQEIHMRRSATDDLRWMVTQFPCAAYAQEADLSLRDFEDFVYGATHADKDNPIEYWEAVHDEQQRIIDWLTGKDEVVVKGPNVDLTLSIKDRLFINADGKKNMPDGEVFTGPVEDSVNGWIRFTYPAIRSGREVDGVEFEFQQGKVVRAKAKKNEEYLLSQLDSDDGARYLGEFAIGTNYGIQRFSKSILFDEKIGGTMHMAVGAGYPETGSVNKSNVHWDFICDMREDSEIRVDGELLYKDGKFQI